MAKRARLTVDEVLLYCDGSNEDYDDYIDPDEPIMDGSDDEFSDLEGNELDDETEEGNLDSSPDLFPTAASPSSSSSSGSTIAAETTWTTATKRVVIQPFTSPTSPIEDISALPMEVFDLFSTDLMEETVKQSNAYAKTVIINGS